MTQRHWTAIILIWVAGLGVLVFGMLFGGSSVAPCLGGQLAPEATSVCVAAWEAQRPWTDRFWETPGIYEALFSILVSVVLLATVLVYWHAKRQRGVAPSRDIRQR